MSNRRPIGMEVVNSLSEGETAWDSRVIGFGVRRQKGPIPSYIVAYRTQDGRQRWHTIGKHGSPWTPASARDEAKRILGVVAQGEDPSGQKQRNRVAPTVADLCEDYMKAVQAGRLLTRSRVPKKPSTLVTDHSRIDGHIKPLLGQMKVAIVTRRDVEKFLHAVAEGATARRTKSEKKHGLSNVRGGRGAASRTVGLLGAIFDYAVRQEMRPDNPVRGTVRFADQRRERRLSDDEYRALGRALREAGKLIWPPAVAATHFLLLTGWRSGEAISLTWDQVDLERRTAFLSDTKTGRSMRPLSEAACDVIRRIKAPGDRVFPASRGAGSMAGFPSIFEKILRIGGLPSDITPHVLRHSYASLAADIGLSEPTIAALIGHKGQSITSRYVHSADAVLLAASDSVAARIHELTNMSTEYQCTWDVEQGLH